jgi:excisionase family DNA binding protein
VDYDEERVTKAYIDRDMAGNDNNSNEIKPMLTVREVAWLLHIHSNTVRRWADRGIIKAYRITSRGDRRFRREDISRFLANLNINEGNKEDSVNSPVGYGEDLTRH